MKALLLAAVLALGCDRGRALTDRELEQLSELMECTQEELDACSASCEQDRKNDGVDYICICCNVFSCDGPCGDDDTGTWHFEGQR